MSITLPIELIGEVLIKIGFNDLLYGKDYMGIRIVKTIVQFMKTEYFWERKIIHDFPDWYHKDPFGKLNSINYYNLLYSKFDVTYGSEKSLTPIVCLIRALKTKDIKLIKYVMPYVNDNHPHYSDIRYQAGFLGNREILNLIDPNKSSFQVYLGLVDGVHLDLIEEWDKSYQDMLINTSDHAKLYTMSIIFIKSMIACNNEELSNKIIKCPYKPSDRIRLYISAARGDYDSFVKYDDGVYDFELSTYVVAGANLSILDHCLNNMDPYGKLMFLLDIYDIIASTINKNTNKSVKQLYDFAQKSIKYNKLEFLKLNSDEVIKIGNEWWEALSGSLSGCGLGCQIVLDICPSITNNNILANFENGYLRFNPMEHIDVFRYLILRMDTTEERKRLLDWARTSSDQKKIIGEFIVNNGFDYEPKR